MKISFWSVGKNNESYVKEGVEDFTRRISRYFKTEWAIIPMPKNSGILPEMELKKKQVKLYEENIIPALKNNYKTMQLGYEQNTEELFMLYDAWEILNMKQLEYIELLNQALRLQVTIERIIENK